MELVFNREHEHSTDLSNLEREASELLTRYNQEIRRHKIAELNAKLSELDEESDEYISIIKQIADLQKTAN